MGCISSNQGANRPSKRDSPLMRGKIDIHCPICEQNYDTDQRKPFIVCANKHKLCFACLTSMKNHASLKKINLLCPFCKMPVEEDLVTTDTGLYGFLEAQLDTLKKLPQEKQKLFAFTSIYLPRLHDFMKKEVNEGSRTDKNSGGRESKGENSVDSIELLRIKGRMLEEYEVFEFDILDCMQALRRVFLSNNHIKAIDVNGFTQDKLTLLDLSFNRITTVKSILSESSLFRALKVLSVRNNQIEEMPGVSNLASLQIVIMKNNGLKSLKWFAGCPALKHLDVQFNQIAQHIEFPQNFSHLYSLCMFGNPTNIQWWESFAKLSWRELRLLTASVANTTLPQKYNIHNRIAKLPAPNLKLLVFQVSTDEPQNEKEVLGSVGQQVQLLSKARRVQLRTDTYIFYMENDSFLRKLTEMVIRYHPLGRNVNFRAPHTNLKIYEEDERLNVYKKIDNNQDPANYLYSLPVGSTAKGKIFISFFTKTFKLLIGVTDKAQTKNRIQLYLDRQTVKTPLQEGPCKSFKGGIRASDEFKVTVALSVDQEYVTFVVGNTQLDRYAITSQWSQYRFYIHIVEKGESIRIIRDELQLL